MLLIAMHGFTLTAYAEWNSWVQVSERVSTSVVLFDQDGDGLAELLAVDNYLYDDRGYENYTGGVPFKFDMLGSGLCLSIYMVHQGLLRVYCRHGVLQYVVPANETYRVYSRGVIIGDFVITRGKAYVSGLAKSSVLFYIENEPVLLGSENGLVVLEYLENGSRVVLVNMSTLITIHAAYYSRLDDSIYALASTDTLRLLLRYHVSTRVFSYITLPLSRVLQAVSTDYSIYALTQERAVYRITGFSEKPELVVYGLRIFYPAEDTSSLTVLGFGEAVKVHEKEGEYIVEKLPLPLLGRIHAVDWWNPIVAVASDTGVYVYSFKPVEFRVEAPSRVYAGDVFEIRVYGNYSGVYLFTDEHVYSSTGELVVSTSLPRGAHSLVVRACVGVYCAVDVATVVASARPLELEVSYPSEAEPYQPVLIEVKALDVLWGKPAETTCTIEDQRGRVSKSFRTGQVVEVPAVPHVNTSVLRITCGGDDYYELVELRVEIKLIKPYLDVKLDFTAPRVLSVYGYDVYTGEYWSGLVIVEVNGERVLGVGSVNVTLKPGISRLHVALVYNNTTLVTKEYTVLYYEAPSVNESVVITRTIYVPHVVEVKTVDPLVIVATASLAAGATYALFTLIRRMQK
ncbi:MAG: hypothetical protein QXT64_02935 [Desulfurococcaceae archaeon]